MMVISLSACGGRESKRMEKSPTTMTTQKAETNCDKENAGTEREREFRTLQSFEGLWLAFWQAARPVVSQLANKLVASGVASQQKAGRAANTGPGPKLNPGPGLGPCPCPGWFRSIYGITAANWAEFGSQFDA